MAIRLERNSYGIELRVRPLNEPFRSTAARLAFVACGASPKSSRCTRAVASVHGIIAQRVGEDNLRVCVLLTSGAD